MLTAAGFRDVILHAASAPMWFGHDIDDAYQLVSRLTAWMLEGLDDNGRSRALDDLRASITAHETPEGVLYDSATWIIGATRP